MKNTVITKNLKIYEGKKRGTHTRGKRKKEEEEYITLNKRKDSTKNRKKTQAYTR